MKTVLMTLTALTIIFTSANAEARKQLPKKQWKGGSQCGLTDEYGSEEWKELGRGWSLGEANPDDISTLPTIIKQQLIITAKRGVDADMGNMIKTAKDAILALREGSEAGDLEVSSFRYNGNDFTQVLTYGGGNPTGLIFVKDTLHAVGLISDSDVECLK